MGAVGYTHEQICNLYDAIQPAPALPLGIKFLCTIFLIFICLFIFYKYFSIVFEAYLQPKAQNFIVLNID